MQKSLSYYQGFIQAVLVSGWRHKKLSLLVKLSNSDLMLKHIGVELELKKS